MNSRRRFRLAIVLGLTILTLSAAVAGVALRHRSLQSELVQAREAVNAKHFSLARQRLSRLAERWTNDGEVLLLKGNSELALGKRDDALASWAKIPISSPFFGKAALSRAFHLIENGRYSLTESLLLEALAVPAVADRHDLETALARVYRYEGRFHDVRRLLRASWCRDPYPAAVLKELWRLDLAPTSGRALEVLAVEGRPGRRPRLAGLGQPCDPDRPIRRGVVLAGKVPESTARRPRGVAGPARPGAGNRRRRRLLDGRALTCRPTGSSRSDDPGIPGLAGRDQRRPASGKSGSSRASSSRVRQRRRRSSGSPS